MKASFTRQEIAKAKENGTVLFGIKIQTNEGFTITSYSPYIKEESVYKMFSEITELFNKYSIDKKSTSGDVNRE